MMIDLIWMELKVDLYIVNETSLALQTISDFVFNS